LIGGVIAWTREKNTRVNKKLIGGVGEKPRFGSRRVSGGMKDGVIGVGVVADACYPGNQKKTRQKNVQRTGKKGWTSENEFGKGRRRKRF